MCKYSPLFHLFKMKDPVRSYLPGKLTWAFRHRDHNKFCEMEKDLGSGLISVRMENVVPVM